MLNSPYFMLSSNLCCIFVKMYVTMKNSFRKVRCFYATDAALWTTKHTAHVDAAHCLHLPRVWSASDKMFVCVFVCLLACLSQANFILLYSYNKLFCYLSYSFVRLQGSFLIFCYYLYIHSLYNLIGPAQEWNYATDQSCGSKANSHNQADVGQELQLIFRPSIRMANFTKPLSTVNSYSCLGCCVSLL